MDITNSLIELQGEYEVDFISLKYLDDNGVLREIDYSANSIKQDPLSLRNSFLKLLDDRHFIDPFRSHRTLTIFCDNLLLSKPLRSITEKILKHRKTTDKYSAFIHFWPIINGKYESKINYVDNYSNLRSEIVKTLELSGIETKTHYYNIKSNSCAIGITGSSIIELADNIVISRYIISNVATSYGLNLQYTNNIFPNIDLHLTVKETQSALELSALTKKSAIISKLCTDSGTQFFEFININIHKFAKAIDIEINIRTNDFFSPYIALLELLDYQIDPVIIEKELNVLLKDY